MPASPQRYAVFGHPIAHSLSPRLHAWFAAEAGIALEYVAVDATPEAFGEGVHAFLDGGGRGANVTLPHKHAAWALADLASPAADRLQVANVLTLLPDGRIEADSNDGAGMLADLRARCACEPRGRNVLLLGAGGAARAAAFALLDASVIALTIANRTEARAQALADALARPGDVDVVPWDALDGCGPFELVVNATSAGVQHAALSLPSNLFDVATVAYDLAYGDAARPFLDIARAAGCGAAHDGLGMLVETAADSFMRWHGVRPDTDTALDALRHSAADAPT